MKRKNINCNGVNISLLDNEKEGNVMICLHGHYGTGSMFAFIEKIFDGRLILIDLRGHGLSEHADSISKEDYVNDLHAIITEMGIENPILLGHSLGGIIVYQYAAKYKNVSKIIVEDIGTEVTAIGDPFEDFPVTFDSIYELNNELAKRGRLLEPYFLESIYYDGLKWKFRFDYKEIYNSQEVSLGTYWDDWEKVKCPILLLHGTKTWACETENIQEMTKRNTNVQLKIYENVGHTIHNEAREQFCTDIKEFLK